MGMIRQGDIPSELRLLPLKFQPSNLQPADNSLSVSTTLDDKAKIVILRSLIRLPGYPDNTVINYVFLLLVFGSEPLHLIFC